MQGHKKKFRKSLRLGIAYDRTVTPIALTTTTTVSTTTTISTTTTHTTTTTTTGRCGQNFQGKGCNPGLCCSFQGYLLYCHKIAKSLFFSEA